MWFKGSKFGVSIWYVCWGHASPEGDYQAELYMTLSGLKRWLLNDVYQSMPIQRIGKMDITENGLIEKEHWASRDEFLKLFGQ